MWQMLAGAGLGLGKYALEDRPKQKAAAMANAESTRGSWTGVPVSKIAVPEANFFGDVMQGAAAGGSMGQSMGSYDSSMALQDSQRKYLDAASGQMSAPAAPGAPAPMPAQPAMNPYAQMAMHRPTFYGPTGATGPTGRGW